MWWGWKGGGGWGRGEGRVKRREEEEEGEEGSAGGWVVAGLSHCFDRVPFCFSLLPAVRTR